MGNGAGHIYQGKITEKEEGAQIDICLLRGQSDTSTESPRVEHDHTDVKTNMQQHEERFHGDF